MFHLFKTELKFGYVDGKVQDCNYGTRKLFRIVEDLSKPKSSQYFNEDPAILIETFGEFFKSRIVNLRTNIDHQLINKNISSLSDYD